MLFRSGVLSRFLYTRYVTPSRKGVFKIEYHVDGEQLKDNFSQLADERPLQLHENRVASGYLPLTPISPHTQYHAFILVE